MFNISDNKCYLAVIRPPTKSVQHCATGSCEIQRVSFDNNHADLQYSIKHSKVLRAYKEKYPFQNPFNSKQCEEIFIGKNIIEEKSKFYVAKTLKELHCTLYGILYLQQLRQQKYDSNIDHHEQLLISIWKNLKPQEKLENRISDQWISIGFQVNNPATDFRGSGYLGLLNLSTFVSNIRGKKAFQIASQPKTQYFFCSAGLFFTMLAMDLMKARNVEYQHWAHDYNDQLVERFQILYEMLFIQFNNFWLEQCPNKSILHFNENLKRFQKIVKQWSPQAIRAHIQSTLY